jgi:oxygen-independent coproporphyrinogen-3 oxidase
LHQRSTVLEEIARLREAGIVNINVDLIAGLPHQTATSWEFSLADLVAGGVPHASVYMLEVDEDSRLGRELIAGGTRYHAHFVPNEGETADFYQQACETLNAAGIEQYEISNFACAGAESRHNLKYWTRQAYLGFGVDAHSMLLVGAGQLTSAAEAVRESEGFPAALKRCSTQNLDTGAKAVRFSTPDSLDAYMNRGVRSVTPVPEQAALEESFFLGLRLNRGVDLEQIRAEFGDESLAKCASVIEECVDDGLLEKHESSVRLTARGRLLSNEVFARFLAEERKVGTGHVNPR